MATSVTPPTQFWFYELSSLTPLKRGCILSLHIYFIRSVQSVHDLCFLVFVGQCNTNYSVWVHQKNEKSIAYDLALAMLNN